MILQAPLILSCDITFKLRESPYTETTYRFYANGITDVDATDYYGTSFSGLLSISGFGSDMGTYLVNDSTGQVLLDNSRHLIGPDLRISDLLDRHTVLGQTITIKAHHDERQLGQGVYSITIFTGECEGVSINPVGDTITIAARNSQLSKDIYGAQITADIYTSAPSNSLGKFVPVVFGEDVQVTPTLISSSTTEARFAYATNLANSTSTAQFKNGGIQQYYIKNNNYNGTYYQVISATNTSTAVISTLSASGSPSAFQYKRNAKLLALASSLNAYVLTHIQVRMDFSSASPTEQVNTSSEWIVEIFDRDWNTGAPRTLLATAKALKNDYLTTIRSGTTSYDLEMTFDKFVPLTTGDTFSYFICFSESTDWTLNGGTGDGGYWKRSGVSTHHYQPFPEATNGTSEERWFSGNDVSAQYAVYGLVLDDQEDQAARRSKGFATSEFTATQRSAPSGQSNPDLTKLDWVLVVDGLQDTSTGSVTGTNNKRFENAQDILKLFTWEHDGSSWANASKYDSSFASDTHNSAFAAHKQVKIAGYYEGRATRRTILEEVCRNTGARVGTTAAGKYGIWGYGTQVTPAYDFTEFESTVRGIDYSSLEGVVNDLDIVCGRYLLNSRFEKIFIDGRSVNYQKQVTWRTGTNPLSTQLVDRSTNLYGYRPLKDSTYDLLSPAGSYTDIFAEIIFVRYGEQHVYAVVETAGIIPNSTFSDLELELLDVVTITHTDCPSHFGTEANAKLPYSTTDSDIASGLIGGQYFRRAKPYRAQVEGIAYDWSNTKALRQIYKLRLITNPRDAT